MKKWRERTHPRLNQAFGQVAGLLAGALGGTAVVGWWLNSEMLKRIVPGADPMKPTIAAGMFLCSMALALLSFGKMAKGVRICAAAIAAMVIIFGALTLGDHFFAWNLRIEGLLPIAGTATLSHPGRMSPATALCFVLIGGALLTVSLFISNRFRIRFGAGLSAAVVIIGVLPLLALFLETLFGPRWNYLGMDISGVTGAVGFALLGSALFALLQSEAGLTWSLDGFTTAGFSLGILLMVLAGAVAFDFTKRMLETTTSVTDTQEILKEIEKIKTSMVDLESGQRGYIIIGDDNLLEGREQRKTNVQQGLATVRKLTAADSGQQHRLDQLERLIAQRDAWEEQTISTRMHQGFLPAQQMIATGRGIALWKSRRQLFAEIENQEYAVLDKWRRQSDVASQTTFMHLPLGVFLSLSILSLGVFFLNAGVGDRAQAETALRESEAQLHTIVENLDEGVVVSNLEGQLLHWNRAALKLHGYSNSEHDRRRFTELVDTFEFSTLGGAPVSVEQWPLARVLCGEKVHDLELRIRRVGSDWQRIFNYGGTLVRDTNDQPLMAIVTISNITERKGAEDEIRQLNIELEERVKQRTADLESANKELEAFSYSVSHDLRAPLRAVDGFSHAVLEDYGAQLPEEGRHYLQTIRDSAQRMGVLIDDLLTFSRLSRLPLNKQAVSMTRLAHEALEELNRERTGRQIDLRIGNLPHCEGDPALLKQVWVNLLSNALKYTRTREAAVVDVGVRKEKGESVYFVYDNGTGFDMQYAHKLFGVFQRLHRSEEFEGTGVGLAIVQRVIHRHGGRVWAQAAPNCGATFYFTLERTTES
jgi:PAS domain S-box-containing protein